MVTAGEIEYALRELDVDNLVDLRRRTCLGMGPVRDCAPIAPPA